MRWKAGQDHPSGALSVEGADRGPDHMRVKFYISDSGSREATERLGSVRQDVLGDFQREELPKLSGRRKQSEEASSSEYCVCSTRGLIYLFSKEVQEEGKRKCDRP